MLNILKVHVSKMIMDIGLLLQKLKDQENGVVIKK